MNLQHRLATRTMTSKFGNLLLFSFKISRCRFRLYFTKINCISYAYNQSIYVIKKKFCSVPFCFSWFTIIQCLVHEFGGLWLRRIFLQTFNHCTSQSIFIFIRWFFVDSSKRCFQFFNLPSLFLFANFRRRTIYSDISQETKDKHLRPIRIFVDSEANHLK